MEEDHQVQQNNSPRSHGGGSLERSEPVRSRWTPKPEQILILESIFNSGMVNPPKEETVRIRKLLEKFGAVGDANVFYWFQNRRSRSRRRQRQMQATLEQRNLNHQLLQAQVVVGGGGGGANLCDNQNNNYSADAPLGFGGPSASYNLSAASGSSSSSSCGGQELGLGGFLSASPQMGFPEIDKSSDASSLLYPSDAAAPNLNYHSGFGATDVSGFITVFINGIATEVPRGPMDITTVFGEDVMLLHSSGLPLPTNEFGFLLQSLQHGESYFLVSKPTQV